MQHGRATSEKDCVWDVTTPMGRRGGVLKLGDWRRVEGQIRERIALAMSPHRWLVEGGFSTSGFDAACMHNFGKDCVGHVTTPMGNWRWVLNLGIRRSFHA